MGISNALICLIGISTVFVGLICIIVLCRLMGIICQKFVKQETVVNQTSSVAPAQSFKAENKQEIIAAVACAIAEELGTDVEGIRIKSFKKL